MYISLLMLIRVTFIFDFLEKHIDKFFNYGKSNESRLENVLSWDYFT